MNLIQIFFINFIILSNKNVNNLLVVKVAKSAKICKKNQICWAVDLMSFGI